ncbi:MAG: glycosyltransferase family 39 protein [Proteobacteria bacterium]|nr:glycosyltransferase family 39 protein [Pseudomonadota bacterium]
MPTETYHKNIFYYCSIVLLLILFFLNCVTCIREKSNTFDESAHLLAGYAFLKEGIDYLEPSHPPTGRSFSAFPLLFFDVKSDLKSIIPIINNDSKDFYQYSLQFLFENSVDGKKLLFWSRIPNIILGVILGLYIFIWAKEVFGKKAAFLSLFLYSLCPNILANAELITTDFPLTAFFFMASFHLYRLSKEPNLLQILASGITIGLLLTVKYTGLFILPSLVCLLGLLTVKESGSIVIKRKVGCKYLLLLFSILVIAYATIWAIYSFQYRPNINTAEWIKISYGQNKPLTNWPILPESYLYGLTKLFDRSQDGHIAFLMVEYSTKGWWYYFIIAFMLKTPIPAIILFLTIFVYFKKYPKEYPTIVLSMLPVAIFFIITSMQNINIGIRHILPVYPFIYLLTGGLCSIKFKRQRLIKYAFTGLMLWYGYNAYSIYPHHLAFFNELAGGPKNGYKYLVDSNLDWGQDLPGLKKYMEKNNIKKVNLSYFGLSNPGYYDIDYNYLHSHVILPIPDQAASAKSIRENRIFAISATMLQGVYSENRNFYGYFRNLTPVEKIGYSIFIYSIEP